MSNATLKAVVIAGEIAVKDVRDGISVWYPSREAAREIAESGDPKTTAVEICAKMPMRGTWKN
jgi:hypothetical protein